MRPSKRDEVSGLLQSTWSALSSRSRRAAASAESLWKQVNPGSTAGPSPEYLYLMPGWAVKRRQASAGTGAVKDEVIPFDLHVSTSGFAVAFRELSAASATQRAVVNIAKRFAALPKLPSESDAGIRNVAPDPAPVDVTDASTRPFDSLASLTSAHTNLDARLTPFWSKALIGRRIKFAVYTIQGSTDKHLSEGMKTDPLWESTARTDEQGLFAEHIVIPWDRLCTHPPSVAMACCDPKDSGTSDWRLLLKAGIDHAPEGDESGLSREVEYRQATKAGQYDGTRDTTGALGPRISRPLEEVVHRARDVLAEQLGVPATTQITIAVSEPKGVRVISDLDDTIKHSDILAGPREVFRNVFCRPLDDVCVPGMADLYRGLASEGVDGFHMISNSPFELYTSIRDFMSIHRFPTMYSLKLKYYGRRSLLGSLMEPAGERKRPSIVEVLDAFPESNFILFGDSGEQDLEVYIALARERPRQIRGIYIRDVTSGRADAINLLLAPILGTHRSLNDDGDESGIPDRPEIPRPVLSSRQGSTASFSSSTDSLDSDMSDEMRSLSSAQQKILRRAVTWDSRMERARKEVPESTELMFFVTAEDVGRSALPLVRSLIEQGHHSRA